MSVHPQLGPPELAGRPLTDQALTGLSLTGRERWHLGGLLTIRAAARDTNGAIAIVEERASRGYATPPHVHGREDETLFVIDGELGYVLDGIAGTAVAGDAVHLPKGLPHHFEVTSAEAHFLVIITPGGFEEFFEELSPPAAAARVPGVHDHAHTDPAHMVRAAATRGTTVFRDNGRTALAAARKITTSNDRTEIRRAYRELSATLVAPAPVLAGIGDVADMLTDVVSARLPADPVHARALILLGILVERPGSSVSNWDTALPRLLQVVGPRLSEAAVLAFAYLLAHFPDHATAIEAAMATTALPEADRQRLLRCLERPDFDSPDAANRIGRVWPSPTTWQLDDAEQELDRDWRAHLHLDAGTAQALWDSETVALLAYMGAKADHAVERTENA